ncbi:MAG: hypothetical protein JXI33_04120 [Candidatus Aminicenantes bacterium]|nr:hypothetical protein [Candidatus Aminicenantes bacterium]
MIRFHKSFFCRAAAVVLVGLLVFQSEFLLAQNNDVLNENFSAARSAYLAGEFSTARSALETLLPELEKVTGRETLKGETHLLLGAILEKLLEKDAAVVQYCLAKALLGTGKSFEGLTLDTLQYYTDPCPETAATQAVIAEDAYEMQFSEAKKAFFAGDFALAKTVLEKLIDAIAPVQGRDTMKGEIYLLSGAVYEKLKYKELAVKYFCLAKEILGKGKTFEGLVLNDFKYYKRHCDQAGANAIKKKSGFGKLLGSLLALAVIAIGGYFLYTKVIKKESKDKEADIYYESEYQAWNCWHASAASSSPTLPTISPANDWAPNPTHANGYDDESTVSISGPDIYHWDIKLAITGCNGLTRRDIIYVDDVQVLDVTNTFDRTCSGNINDFCNNPVDGMQYEIASGAGEVTLKLRHRIIFTTPANNPVRMMINSSFLSK